MQTNSITTAATQVFLLDIPTGHFIQSLVSGSRCNSTLPLVSGFVTSIVLHATSVDNEITMLSWLHKPFESKNGSLSCDTISYCLVQFYQAFAECKNLAASLVITLCMCLSKCLRMHSFYEKTCQK